MGDDEGEVFGDEEEGEHDGYEEEGADGEEGEDVYGLLFLLNIITLFGGPPSV